MINIKKSMKDLSQETFEFLTLIPKGKVVTYGQIAAYLGNKALSRVVGNILHNNPSEELFPCYKVVNSQGKLAPNFVFGGVGEQKARLERDGIEVVNNKVDLKKYQWKEAVLDGRKDNEIQTTSEGK